MLCNTTNQTDVLIPVNNWRSIWFYTTVPLSLLGILLNLICLRYFTRHQYHGSANKFMIAVACVDLTLCISCVGYLAIPITITTDTTYPILLAALDFAVSFLLFETTLLTFHLWYVRIMSVLKPLRARWGRAMVGVVLVETVILFAFCVAATQYFTLNR